MSPAGLHVILLRDKSRKYITNRAPVFANGAPRQNNPTILTGHHQEQVVRAVAFLSPYRHETHLT